MEPVIRIKNLPTFRVDEDRCKKVVYKPSIKNYDNLLADISNHSSDEDDDNNV